MRLKSPSIRGDNPMIPNLIAAIYRGDARSPAGDVVESLQYPELKIKLFLSLLRNSQLDVFNTLLINYPGFSSFSSRPIPFYDIAHIKLKSFQLRTQKFGNPR